jgi:hypothetical protein
MIIHGIDYQVTWNGGHGNGDFDLLGVPEKQRIHQKRAAPKLQRNDAIDVTRYERAHWMRRSKDENFRAISEKLRKQELTQSELEKLCHCKADQVKKALARLRQAGILQRSVGGGLARPRCRYWIDASQAS